jgi:P63C domain
MVRALGTSIGSAGRGEGDRLFNFATGKAINPFISNDLISRMRNPVRFQAPTGGTVATGYEAEILPDLCDAVLDARKSGALMHHQFHIAEHCEILLRGLARVGIIALIDEATGYQKDRAKHALQQILEAFIAKELQPYVQTFPAEYYQELFRLRGLEFPADSVKRPQYFGVLTNDIIYK